MRDSTCEPVGTAPREPRSLLLRPFRTDDLVPLHTLDVECFAAPFRFSQRALKQFIEDPRAVTVVAEQSGEVAGFLVLHLEGTLEQKLGYVVTLDVRTAFRRAGTGRRLMLEGEKLAREHAARAMCLHVFTGNAGALDFYHGLGFAELDRVPGFYGRHLDALYLTKRLVER